MRVTTRRPGFGPAKGKYEPQTSGPILVGAPPIIGGVVVGGYDRGSWKTLNLDTLRQLWRWAERLSGDVIGKLDTRDVITATIPATSIPTTVVRADLEVPEGELWFITAIEVNSAAAAGLEVVTSNFRISTWPDDAATPDADGKAFWAVAIGNVAGVIDGAEFHESAPLFDPEDSLPFALRLPAGSTITLVCTQTGANAAAARASTLTPFGFKVTALGD